MTQLTIPFIGARHVSDAVQVNAQRAINWYPNLEGDGAESVLTLKPTAGITQRLTAGNGPCRSKPVIFQNTLCWVSGAQVLSMNSSEVVTVLGTIGTTTGRCYLAAGRTYLMVVDGAKGYSSHNLGALAEITDGQFPASPTTCAYLNGYFIVTAASTDAWNFSANEDPTLWDALDFFSADAKSDDALAVVATTRDVYIFGAISTQVYYPVETSDVWALYTNGVLEFGAVSAASIARAGGNIFLLAQPEDGGPTVLVVNGFTSQRITDPDLARALTALQSTSTISDAEGFAYIEGDQTFYVLTFPTADITWVYHLEQNMWHERQSSGYGRWRVSGSARFNGRQYVGDAVDGRIGALDNSTYTEYGNTIRRVRRMSNQHRERRQFEINAFEVQFDAGVGLTTGQGSDPQAMLRYSMDGGRTWSVEMWRPIGRRGEYKNRTRWTRFGTMNAFLAELVVTDPFPATVISAFADINLLSP